MAPTTPLAALRRAGAGNGRAGAASRPRRIVLSEPDPYLAFLITLNFPETEVVEAPIGASPSALVDGDPDLIVVNLENRGASDVLAGARGRARVLGVVDGKRASRTALPADLDGLLVRPFLPTELARAVRRALGEAEPSGPRSASRLERAHYWMGMARIAAVLVAGVGEFQGSGRATMFLAALTYAVFRLVFKRRPGRIDVVVEVATAAAAIALGGGPSSGYTLYGLVAAASAGMTLGGGAGAVAGLVVAAGSAHPILTDVRAGSLEYREVAAWAGLLALAGVVGGMAARIWRLWEQQGANLLAEANRVLSALHRLARTMPGGLEVGTVAAAALDEIRDTIGAPAGALLVGETGTFAVVSSFGLPEPDRLVLTLHGSRIAGPLRGKARVARSDEMDPATAARLDAHACWLCAPLERGEVALGVLLAACNDHSRHHEHTILLQQLADDTAVAVENARLFASVRDLSADEERRQIARELHDGVAQALTHLRLELDFMARHRSLAPEAVQREVERLARVVDRAVADVRSMILGMRASVAAEGLASSIRSYLRDVRTVEGPEISFQARGDGRLPTGVEAEVFRIAQEAVSNAMRHAHATQIKVLLQTTPTRLRLSVEDDGIGIQPAPRLAPGGGMGLPAMRERAAKIGASLTLREAARGGTLLELDCLLTGEPRSAAPNAALPAEAAEGTGR